MLAPGATVDGAAELVTAMSAEAGIATKVFTVAVLFARLLSLMPELTESVSLTVVPLGVATPTWTTSVKWKARLCCSTAECRKYFRRSRRPV